MPGCIELLFLTSFFFLCSCSVTYPIVFDDFTTPTFTAASFNHSSSTRITRAETIWGGERDLAVLLFEPITSSDSISCNIQNGAATVVSHGTTSSSPIFQYDGLDYKMKFTNTSLSPQNLLVQEGQGIKLHAVVSEDTSCFIIINIDGSSCSYPFKLLVGIPDIFIDFRLFLSTTDQKCDFTRVNGIELSVLLENESIFSLSFFGTYANRPVPSKFDQFEVAGKIDLEVSDSTSKYEKQSCNTICCYTSIIGGQRDFFVVTEETSPTVNSFIHSDISSGVLSLISGVRAQGIAILQYDGPDDSIVLNEEGLGFLDLTNDGLRSSIFFSINTNQTISIEVAVSNLQDGAMVQGFASVEVLFGMVSAGLDFSSLIPSVDCKHVGAVEIRFFFPQLCEMSLWDIALGSSPLV